MVVGELSDRTDVLVIGGGPGGYAAALRCARGGKSVTLVERDRIGGTCLNIGCIPSKVLIHTADVAHLATRSATWGVKLTAEVDVTALRAHTTTVVDNLTGGVEQLLAAAGVTVIIGEARFSRSSRVAVTSGDLVSHLEFDDCVVASGSRPIAIPGFEPDGVRVVDSTGALSLDAVPATMVVVGGGYIGLELGTAWAKLGAHVTIVEAAVRLLPEMDRRLSSVVARRLKELGVVVHTSSTASGLTDDGVSVQVGGESITIPGEVVVVAVGRRPNTEDMGLELTGAIVDERGHVVVGPDRRAADHLFAIGDITTGPALAHKATAEAEVAAATILGQRAAFNPAAIAAVVFSDPEVATIGLTVDEAKAAGIEPIDFRFPFSAGSRSRTLDDTAGYVQIVADESRTVIGVHMAGVGVSELAAGAALAIEMSATLDDYAGTIHPHPTMSEALLEAAHGALGAPLHVLR